MKSQTASPNKEQNPPKCKTNKHTGKAFIKLNERSRAREGKIERVCVVWVGKREVNFICMMLANIGKSVQRGTNNNNNDDVDDDNMGEREKEKEAD